MGQTLADVLVVGATGRLGGLIVNELLRLEGVRVRALVRGGRASSLPGDARIATHVDDLSGPSRLDRAAEGATCIVSAVQGGPDVPIDDQLRLVDAGKRQGVERFNASDFSFDLFALEEGANVNSDCERMQLWGDGREPMDFSTYRDTARFTALAATFSDVPHRLCVGGARPDFWQLKDSVERAAGIRLHVDQRGSLADLDDEIAQRMGAEPDNLYSYLPLMYWRAMLDGTGRLRDPVNARYPDVRTTTVGDYVAQHRDAFRPASP